MLSSSHTSQGGQVVAHVDIGPETCAICETRPKVLTETCAQEKAKICTDFDAWHCCHDYFLSHRLHENLKRSNTSLIDPKVLDFIDAWACRQPLTTAEVEFSHKVNRQLVTSGMSKPSDIRNSCYDVILHNWASEHAKEPCMTLSPLFTSRPLLPAPVSESTVQDSSSLLASCFRH